jgi:hypothetical protein
MEEIPEKRLIGPMKTKETIKNLAFVTIPTILIFCALFELVLHTVLPAAKRPRYCYDRVYNINRNDPSEPDGYWTMGKWCRNKTRWHINNYGWNSSIDYKPEKTPGRKRICIIGDSYIEALSVDVSRNVAARIREYGGDKYEVYSFGFGGAPLSQYLQMSRYIRKVFNPDMMIVQLIHNDFDESLVEYPKEPSNMHIRIKNDSCFEEPGTIPPYTIKRYLLKSAIVRYLEYNLIVRVRIKELLGKNNFAYNSNINPDTVAARKPKITIATNYLIRKFKEENPSCELVFLMNAPINDIQKNTLSTSNVVWMNTFAKEIVEKNNLTFIDLTPAFEDDYRKYHRRFDFGDLDGHWNELGHDIIAKVVINYLNAHWN